MPVITYDTTPTRGTASTVTLDKAALAAVSSVAGDTYYSDNTNWKDVICYFRSSTSRQKELVHFDATQTTPTSSFLVSSKSRGDFQIDLVIIKDFDGGYFQVGRSELNVGEFDIIFAEAGPYEYYANDFTDFGDYMTSVNLSPSANTLPVYYDLGYAAEIVEFCGGVSGSGKLVTEYESEQSISTIISDRSVDFTLEFTVDSTDAGDATAYYVDIIVVDINDNEWTVTSQLLSSYSLGVQQYLVTSNELIYNPNINADIKGIKMSFGNSDHLYTAPTIVISDFKIVI